MVQMLSRRSLTAEARVRSRASPCGICGGQSDTGTGFLSAFLVLPLSVSFHRSSPYSCVTRGMNIMLVGGRSSETSSHPIDMMVQRCLLPPSASLW
jgi:hypothetical protein